VDARLFSATFALIFLAELPDKTALAVLVMASRQNPRGVFAGAAAAFVIQSMVAIVFGSFLGLLPPGIVHRIAGALFWVFAVALLLKKEESEEASIPEAPARNFWKAAATSFTVIFLAEWGDLTQLATATLAAKYKAPLTIFSASVLALWSVTAVGAGIGHAARRRLQPEKLRWVAAAAFALVGSLLLFRH